MNAELKGKFIQNLGFTVVKGVNAIKAGADLVFGKDNSFKHSYQLKMMEEARHPNMLAAKGWATIIATVMISTLVANSLK